MRRLFILFAIVCISWNVEAQKLEVGLFLGLSNYQGDLQPNPLGGAENHFAYGVFGRYQLLDYLSVRANVYRGGISGNDNLQSLESGRKRRNLSFRSDIMELGIMAEFNPIPLISSETSKIEPYIFTGVTGFHYRPYAYFEGRWYELQPLGTEGQSDAEKYKLFQIAIPMGIGTKIRVSDFSSIGLEFGMRKTFSDYLDDVSTNYPDIFELQERDPIAASLSYRIPEYKNEEEFDNPVGQKRGSKAKDWYTFAGLTFSFNLSGLFSIGHGPGNYSPF